MCDIPIDKPMDNKWITFVTSTKKQQQMNNEDPYWASWT